MEYDSEGGEKASLLQLLDHHYIEQDSVAPSHAKRGWVLESANDKHRISPILVAFYSKSCSLVTWDSLWVHTSRTGENVWEALNHEESL